MTGKFFRKALMFAASFAFLLPSFYGCGNRDEFYSFNGTVFGDLPCVIQVLGGKAKSAGAAAIEFLNRFDGEVSAVLARDASGNRTVKSPVYEFNRDENKGAGYEIEIGKDLYDIAKECQSVYAETGGLFNPAIYPLVELWGLSPDKLEAAHEPLDGIIGEVDGILAKCDYSKIELRADGINGKYYLGLKEGAAPDMKLDFGGHAKGWAADKTAAICAGFGVKAAMINIAGNLYTFGLPAEDTPWNIGVTDPLNPYGSYFARVESGPISAVTSGTYERRYFVDGTGEEDRDALSRVEVPHIIDPRTGWPINLRRDGETGQYSNDPQGVVGASVFYGRSSLADVYATYVCIVGLEKGLEFLREKAGTEEIAGIIITADRRYALTEPFVLSGTGNAEASFRRYTRCGEFDFAGA
ncbi:MAG: FAD:protein FMN transferase [Clostridiales bacterium]|jgi:thiamine biosynthesis lipoprotein|nr:FAD:protein FMN transferase [Clostridiales bacterium]